MRERPLGDSELDQPVADALNTILSSETQDPEQMRVTHEIVRDYFQQYRNSLPAPMYRIGRRLIIHAIEEVMGQGDYKKLFDQFADDPYLLAKILTKRDPDKFFDLFLVTWGLRRVLADYVRPNPEDPPADRGGGGGGRYPGGPENEVPRIPPRDIIQKIRDNLDHLDEEDIFEIAIVLFKQPADEEKDGFEKGFEELLTLLDGVKDPENIAKVERVFDRFDELIHMGFGQFTPHLKRRNFPYITVRRAIKEMEEMQDGEDIQRRFAYFDTRTGKTSLALLEPEYLGKNRVIYICPPDTIPTIEREYELYGGDPSKIRVARTENEIQQFIDDEDKNNIRYFIIPSSLVATIDASEQNGNGADDEIDDADNLVSEDGAGRDANEVEAEIEGLRGEVNNATLRLFDSWQPDYVAVDEARYFTGYNCNAREGSSRRSQALLYLLNNRTALENRMAVRLLDATPGDLPRHFYPLISMLYPTRFPVPEFVREEAGSQPYLLSSIFSERTDQAAHYQVYDRPRISVAQNGGPRIQMGPAQNAIYDYASRYSVNKILHRISLARIATFDPVVLRPALRRLMEQPMSRDDFEEYFSHVYNEWQVRSQNEKVPFNWDFIASFSDSKSFANFFSFERGVFEGYCRDDSEKLKALDELYGSEDVLSCKAQYVIDQLNDIVARAKAGERHPKRIIIYSSFKKGLTRDIDPDSEEVTFAMSRFLADQIRQHVPDVNVYSIDGGVSTQKRKDGTSARDGIRESWRRDEGINVLVAVGASTCQGIDLAAPDNMIQEFYMDYPLDSRLDYQIRSRSIGPNQNRTVSRQTLHAVTANDRVDTIDVGARDLLVSKYLFRDLVCRGGAYIHPSFLSSIENRATFLGGFCESENNGEEVVEDARRTLRNRLETEDKDGDKNDDED
jgi:hypothetical protein